MAEFLTMSEAEDKFGSKGKTNAALTLGIIGTGLAALSNNHQTAKRKGKWRVKSQATKNWQVAKFTRKWPRPQEKIWGDAYK